MAPTLRAFLSTALPTLTGDLAELAGGYFSPEFAASQALPSADLLQATNTFAPFTAHIVEPVSDDTRRKIMSGTRNRPKVQELVVPNGLPKAELRGQSLDIPERPPSDAIALVEAARRVRNDLLDSGKEEADKKPFDGEDDEWARAALDAAHTLLTLFDQDGFRPPNP